MYDETNDQELILDGNGTGIEQIKKRNRTKFVNNYLMKNLKALHLDSNSNEESNYWAKRYTKSFYCSSELKSNAGVFTSKFCGYKVCLICSRIRTAQLIRDYYEAVEQLPEKQFVTLTIPNVPEYALPEAARNMVKNFALIRDVLRKTDNKIRGTRNMEITYNPDRDDFHPHFHCIISGRAESETLVDYWLKMYPDATRAAQDIREFGTEKGDLLEAFKYVNKVISETKKERVATDEAAYITIKKRGKIYIEALDIINRAVSGVGQEGKFRTFQSFGIKRKKLEPRDEKEKPETSPWETDFWTYMYDYENHLWDWVNFNTGEALTNFTPSENLSSLLSANVEIKRKARTNE